jgi:HPt (histidine-containing phosphotransfer) domain-containing protein
VGSPVNPTPEEKIAAARTRLAELAEKFVERTRGELDVMRRSLDELASTDGAALGEILHLAHRISGTGATLGFEAVSERARILEQLLAQQPAGAPCGATVVEQVRRAIESLAAELAAAAPRTP